jgi:hypothetical protein
MTVFKRGNKYWYDFELVGIEPSVAASTLEIKTLKLSHLNPTFKKMLLTEKTPERIAQLQTKRLIASQRKAQFSRRH